MPAVFAAIDLVNLAIYLVVLIALAAIVWWFVQQSGIVIPKPLMIVVYAVLAILCILLLADLAGVGPGWVRTPVVR